MPEIYANGELFVYCNGDRWELGQVKSPNNTGDGYFCWYSTGDTAANTPVRCMHKLANAGWSHVERTCKFVSNRGADYPPACSECGYELGIYDCEWFDDGTYGYDGNYCPNCGRRVE